MLHLIFYFQIIVLMINTLPSLLYAASLSNWFDIEWNCSGTIPSILLVMSSIGITLLAVIPPSV